MDVIAQKCNACGAVNAANAANWVRLFGVTLGNSAQPIRVFQPRTAAAPVVNHTLDFCPACAAKTTVDKLPALLAAKS